MAEEKGYLPELAVAKETRTLPYEIEAKLPIFDKEELVRRITESGATLQRENMQLTDTYYGLGEKGVVVGGVLTTAVRVDAIKDRGAFDQALSYLGVRVKEHMSDKHGEIYMIERPSRIPQRHIRFRDDGQGGLTFTVKTKREVGGVGHIDKRVEIEIPIQDSSEITAFLQKLGYKKGRSETKERTAYSLGKALIEINTLPQHGGATYAEIEASSEEILIETAQKLGVQRDELISMSTKHFLAYLAERGLHQPQQDT
ncbi:CYTH domain-containing protein [Candidatus Uhrbacteria bacterium]|nr:CYTH domain-containing protein [Candidatus Uhrbacteria bacterium]